MRTRGFEIISDYREKNIRLPERKTRSSAGYDLEAAADVALPPRRVTLIPTGLKAYMQQDEYLGIHIRSGFSIKNSVTLINGQGVIDADYYGNSENEGHIMIAVMNQGDAPVLVEKGMRVAQGIFYRYLTADDDAAARCGAARSGGMGSTGER